MHAAGLYEAFEDGRIDQPGLQQVFASYVAALSMGRRLVLCIESSNSSVRPALPPAGDRSHVYPPPRNPVVKNAQRPPKKRRKSA